VNTHGWLDEKFKDLRPLDSEWGAVQNALDTTVNRIGEMNRFPIAERHPSGSFEKRTMLAGRKEADLVVVLQNPPTEETLEEMKDWLAGLPGCQAETLYKAIRLKFPEGVEVDVLPVALDGRTAPGSDIPPKLRVALNGVQHTKWFKRMAQQDKPLREVVMLLKAFKQENHPAWKGLFSFALEVMAVSVLETFEGKGLLPCFREVLVQTGNGLLLKPLLDPADPSNDLIEHLDAEARERIATAAQRAVKMIDEGQMSQVFPGAEPLPPAGRNLGGRTLA
jgi:hypothetical protein